MTSSPTSGATEDRSWSPSPVKAFIVRVLVVVLPLVASYLSARIAGPGLWRPDGRSGLGVFIVQMGIVGSVAALLAERQVRRLLPLATLLNMTLVFPDRAPSRFGVALRSGTAKRLMERSTGRLASSHQLAAEQLVAMVAALGRHERLTRGHTERVRAYADLIGQELGLTQDEQQLLSWGALSHDVGKLTVPAEILSSSRKPTEDEWQVLRGHPAAGAEMVAPLADWLGEWRHAAGHHHERWDGGGYPEGLAGTEISLAGRIVAVADAFDVITANRSYKKALSFEAAREEMVRCSGGQFDPAVVRALLQASLGPGKARLGVLGWLAELGGLSALPRGAAQLAVGGATAASVVAAAATGGALVVDWPSEWAAAESPPSALHFDAEPSATGLSATTSTFTGLSTAMTTQPTTTTRPTATTQPTTTGTPPSPTTAPSPTTTAAATTTTITTTAATTTTTAATTTTLGPSPEVWNLGNAASGTPNVDTSTTELLPLTDYLWGSSLRNYSTNRDSEPGLLVQKGDGISETDNTKMQRWWISHSDAQLAGNLDLRIWVALKDFETSKSGVVEAAVYDCNLAGTGCTQLATGDVQFDQATFGSDFGEIVIGMGSVNRSFGPDRTLVVKAAPRSSSDDDLWFAYATVGYHSRLIVS